MPKQITEIRARGPMSYAGAGCLCDDECDCDDGGDKGHSDVCRLTHSIN